MHVHTRYVCNEDFDKAVSCYRYALRLDDRHYNAWCVRLPHAPSLNFLSLPRNDPHPFLPSRYGLGSIYFRQEKYELAEYHFARALNINDQSSVSGGWILLDPAICTLCVNL